MPCDCGHPIELHGQTPEATPNAPETECRWTNQDGTACGCSHISQTGVERDCTFQVDR